MKAEALYLVAGAPGSGKSTVVERLLERPSEYVVFDMDALIEPASALTGRDIRTAPETWPPYNALWLSVLCAVRQNGLTPVLLTPNDPSDFSGVPLPKGCTEIRWLLLDCDDEARRERLRARGWDEGRVQYALEDAALMRRLIPERLDSSLLRPDEVAAAILTRLRGRVRE